jgi:hypothetical protein
MIVLIKIIILNFYLQNEGRRLLDYSASILEDCNVSRYLLFRAHSSVALKAQLRSVTNSFAISHTNFLME